MASATAMKATASTAAETTTAAMEAAGTRSAAAKAESASRHVCGVETASRRARTAVNPMCVAASRGVVRARTPIEGAFTELAVEMSTVAIPVAIANERSLIDPPWGIEAPGQTGYRKSYRLERR